ncbi:hypothetical protein JOQ06_000998 [Pogonophryne albipinna]|uniref:Transposase Tc1-like domain-containing protein n=1 Tax=Pogonophryne albipinna TaxID=1090488 RepID=A0AAD6B4K0_9TELE|nr:hypothetical protein JOQ06_000998 [Pogonophryne albipinna]
MITRTVSKNPRTTRGDLVNDLQRAGTKVTKATISNTLRCQGLKSCSARHVPLLKPVHVQARLKFAREHLDDPEEDWENVIWSDETKIELFGLKQMLTHLSSLKGSALTCGVSTDLLNTAPSAPEITEDNIRQEAAVNRNHKPLLSDQWT